MSRDEGYLSVAQCNQLSNRFNVVGAMLKSLWKQWQRFPNQKVAEGAGRKNGF